MKATTRGALIALSVAALFGAQSAFAGSQDPDSGKKDAKVKCTGINQCSGKGECAGAGNSCAGKNSCKGMGVLEMSADECAKKGGKVVKE